MRYVALVLVFASRVAFAQSAQPNMWRYDATMAGSASSVTTWEGGDEVFAGTPAFFVETVTISPDGEKRVDERRYFQKTDMGVLALGSRTATAVGSATSIDERVAVTPSIALPLPFVVGTKWEGTTSVRVATTPPQGAAASTTASVHIVGEVIGTETITVPAGTFECVIVRDTKTTTGATEDVEITTSWYAAKVGLVKSTTTTTHGTNTLQLHAYQVPRPPWQMSSIGLVPAGEPAPNEPEPTQAPPEATPAVTADVTASQEAEDDAKRAKRRSIGRRLMIVGGAVTASGLALGLLAWSQWSTAKDDCDGDIKSCKNAQLGQAQIDTNAARNLAAFSTGFTIVGLLVGGAGAYLWFATPRESGHVARIQPSITNNSATLTLSGSW